MQWVIFFWTINFCLLRPLKAKDFIPEVAEKLDLPKDLVKDIVDYYWQEVRRSLSGLKHQRIHITNLGDFTIKHRKLDEKMKKVESFESANKLKGLQLINARFKTAETLYDLKNMKSMIDKENQRAEFVRLHKKTLNDTKKCNPNLESQG